jgi:outer membrane protein OmpA-like peptidoglycan-associated protein
MFKADIATARWLAAAVGVLLMLQTVGAALAQQPTASDIANSLVPRVPLTRGLTVETPKAAQDRKLLDVLKNKASRSITVEERDKVAEIAKDKPAIDLEVNFEFGSASIGVQALDVLTKLGVALRDPRLSGATILLAGHTDAKGGDAYNKDLSDRRAEAVKQFLVAKFNLSPENLVAIGYGKERLKNPSDPLGSENRRVQVVNVAAQ